MVLMDMQEQEEEEKRVGVLVDSGAIDLLSARECADALETAVFSVEAHSDAQAEGLVMSVINWKVYREELGRGIARKRQANPAR